MKKIFILFIAIFLCGCTAQKNDEYSETRFLMDTVCSIKAGGENSEEAVFEAFNRINEIAQTTDYHSKNSEIAKINSASANEEIQLSADIEKIITISLDISKKTDGAFDITTAPLKDLWRISDGPHSPPHESDIKKALQNVGYEQLDLNTEKHTLTKLSSFCKIDLSGAAKGYAADCAADILKKNGCTYAVIDLGGNIYVYGYNPSNTNGKWIIGIQKPFAETGAYSQTLSLSQGAVVTAGCYQRYFEWDNKIYHHITNPKTGYPSDSDILSASVKAESALLADCLSTACMVTGEEKGRKIAELYNTELYVEK